MEEYIEYSSYVITDNGELVPEYSLIHEVVGILYYSKFFNDYQFDLELRGE